MESAAHPTSLSPPLVHSNLFSKANGLLDLTHQFHLKCWVPPLALSGLKNCGEGDSAVRAEPLVVLWGQALGIANLSGFSAGSKEGWKGAADCVPGNERREAGVCPGSRILLAAVKDLVYEKKSKASEGSFNSHHLL